MNRDLAIRQDRLKGKLVILRQAARLTEREPFLAKKRDCELPAQLRFAQAGRCQDVIGDRDWHDAVSVSYLCPIDHVIAATDASSAKNASPSTFSKNVPDQPATNANRPGGQPMSRPTPGGAERRGSPVQSSRERLRLGSYGASCEELPSGVACFHDDRGRNHWSCEAPSEEGSCAFSEMVC